MSHYYYIIINSIANALELCLSCPWICGTNTTHEVMMCHTPFPFQRVNGASHTGRLEVLAISTLCLPANLTDWYVAQKQVMRTISRSKGRWSNHMGCWKFFYVCSMAIWPIHFIWGTKKKPWRNDASHTSRSKCQGYIPFCAYLTDLLDIKHKHNSWDDDMSHTVSRSKGQVMQVVWSFCSVRFMGSCLFDRFMSYVAQIQPMRGQCVMHH